MFWEKLEREHFSHENEEYSYMSNLQTKYVPDGRTEHAIMELLTNSLTYVFLSIAGIWTRDAWFM